MISIRSRLLFWPRRRRWLTNDGIIERKEGRIIRLEKLLADFKRALYGAKSEKANPDQYHLALEDIETPSHDTSPDHHCAEPLG